MKERRVAEVFPPGDFIREELEARGWTQVDLADITGKSLRLINEVIAAKRCITPETAQVFGKAFGTSAEFWMNMDSRYQLSRVKYQGEDVPRRARLYELFPVKEMFHRRWIQNSSDVDALEARFKRFFEVDNLATKPKFQSYAAKKSIKADTDSPTISAWLYRSRQLAREQMVERFSLPALESALRDLRNLMMRPEDIEKVPARLAAAGVRFLVVQAFPGMKLDGVCYWLSADEPVVALTLRQDRIDNFWFVLMHELRHVANRDSLSIDENLCIGPDNAESANRDAIEKRADTEAAEFIVSQENLLAFARRNHPIFSDRDIVSFARSAQVHPGIIVGQLQHLDFMPYSHHRKHLVKVREYMIRSATKDGWGTEKAA